MVDEVKTRKPRTKTGMRKRDFKGVPLDKLPDLLNIYEVADILMLDHNCLRRWIHNGKLPVIQLTGGKVLIQKADMLALLDKSKITYVKIEKSVSPSA